MSLSKPNFDTFSFLLMSSFIYYFSHFYFGENEILDRTNENAPNKDSKKKKTKVKNKTKKDPNLVCMWKDEKKKTQTEA